MATFYVDEPITMKNTNNSSTKKFKNPAKLPKSGPLRKLELLSRCFNINCLFAKKKKPSIAFNINVLICQCLMKLTCHP